MRTIFNNMLFSAASVALTAGLVAYADPSTASVPQAQVPQARVVYADLDMRSAAGRATLDRRIRTAAARVCATDDAANRFEELACRAQAIAGAHRSLDAQTADARTPAVQVAAN